jgi:hypothetical protein
MRFLLNARVLAATAAAAGAALLGASVGGMTSVDRELQAATAPAAISQSHLAVYETRADTTDCAGHRNWRDF